jgi:Restriction endonuclease NotI
VLIHPDDPKEWCAVEVQAVYFSGKKMGDHLAQFEKMGNSIPFPNAVRRPDFRSSGPKRLMPQLQTKVPTLRRWGRKTAVIIDAPFAKSLGQFKRVDHISNCDIVWIVVDFDVETGQLYLADTIRTTLESSVEALTAGVPTSKQDFEAKVDKITSSKSKAMQKKVFRLS